MLWETLLSRLRSLGQQSCWGRSLARAIRAFPLLAVAFGVALAHAAKMLGEPSLAQAAFVGQFNAQTIVQKPEPDFPLQPHPLPPTLAQWHDSNAGDYFDQIEVVPVGYLVWTRFPVTVYVQPPTATELENPFTAQRANVWITAVSQAVQEWNRYLPLTLVDQANGADIIVLRSPPPLQVEASPIPNENSASGQTQRDPRSTLQIGRARSALTSYKVYVKKASKDAASKPMLAHRCTIQLRPDQAPQYLQAAARHELGHAIGIWGHSRSQADVMYFSQVRQPPPISARDLNTLKRIYEQPTRLGWALVEQVRITESKSQL